MSEKDKRYILWMIIIVLAIILFSFLLWSLILGARQIEVPKREMQLVNFEYEPDSNGIVVDSATLRTLVVAIDSINDRQINWYDNYLSDLRQESNNIINKHNGWLGFWIALLAIVMGILPFFFNLKMENRYEKEMNEWKEHCNNLIQEKTKECQNRVDEIKKQLEKEHEKLDCLSVQSTAISLRNIADKRLFYDQANKEDLWTDLLKTFTCKLNNMVSQINKCTDMDEESVLSIKDILINIHTVLNLWYPELESKMNSKRISTLISKNESLIIGKPNETFKEDVVKFIKEVRYLIMINT